MAAGTVDTAYVLHLGHTVFSLTPNFAVTNTGTLKATGGTLTGTRVWTRASGGGGSRAPAPAPSSN